jgi:hypothetical protein
MATAQLRAQVLALRTQGWTYKSIGSAMGFTGARAYQVLQQSLAEVIKEPAAEIIALELARLDTLLTGCFEQAEAGDTVAIDCVLRIMAHRARLLGLDKALPVVSNEQPLVIHIVGVPAPAEPRPSAPLLN